MYNRGEGVVHDDQQAVYWYRKAAEQGYAMAQRNLGVMYVMGQGVSADEAEALRWFEKAAAQGLAKALVNEAILFMDGSTTRRDYPRALTLLQQATASGEEAAKPLLEKCRKHVNGAPAIAVEAASSNKSN